MLKLKSSFLPDLNYLIIVLVGGMNIGVLKLTVMSQPIWLQRTVGRVWAPESDFPMSKPSPATEQFYNLEVSSFEKWENGVFSSRLGLLWWWRIIQKVTVQECRQALGEISKHLCDRKEEVGELQRKPTSLEKASPSCGLNPKEKGGRNEIKG